MKRVYQKIFIIFPLIFLLILIVIRPSLNSQIRTNLKDSNGEVSTQSNGVVDEGTTEQDLFKSKGISLFQTVKQGGPLMIVLILFAITSLTLIIERIIFFTRNKIWDPKQMEDMLLRKAKESKAKYKEDLEDDLREEFQLYTNKLEKTLSLLFGIGQLSPIVGFLGTVLGMINAFASIAVATTVNAKVVAVGIQIALVTTAGGLIVAAPTLTAFYFFSHVINNRYTRSEEVINSCSGKLPKLSQKIGK